MKIKILISVLSALLLVAAFFIPEGEYSVLKWLMIVTLPWLVVMPLMMICMDDFYAQRKARRDASFCHVTCFPEVMYFYKLRSGAMTMEEYSSLGEDQLRSRSYTMTREEFFDTKDLS